MRIEKIRIENLNSLYGVHEIDFTTKEYQESNLFLLCGDTGAGKSTVLDAITLALYGQTSRLRNINSSGNEIMSKGTHSCSAEMTFSLDNKRYRAKWSQQYKQAQRKSEGRQKGEWYLDDYTREFCTLNENGEDIPFSGTKSAIDKIIEETIKLKYDQFTKAVLLEQGKFAEFMSANETTRSEILEKLTGTEIYSNLMKMAKERADKEAAELDKAKAVLKGIELLSPEEVAALEESQKSIQAETQSLDTAIKECDNQIKWLDDLDNARKRMDQIESERTEHQKQYDDFKPIRSKLESGQRAERIAHLYDQFNQKKVDFKKEKDDLENLLNKKPGIKKALQDAEKNKEDRELELQIAKQIYKDNKPHFDKVRQLQTELHGFQREFTQAEENYQRIAEQYKKTQTKKQDIDANIDYLCNRIKAGSKYFEEHAIDEKLISELEAIKELNANLEKAENHKSDAEEAVQNAQKELKKQQKVASDAEKELHDKEENHKKLESEAEKAKAAYIQACDGHHPEDLEARIQDQQDLKTSALLIASYEIQRLELDDDEHCPLCGSLEHPYCHGLEKPEVSKYDAEINRLDAHLKSIRAAEKNKNQAVENEHRCSEELSEIRSNTDKRIHERDISQRTLEEKTETLLNAQAAFTEQLQKFNQKVEPFGEKVTDSERAETVCQELTKRREDWKKALEGVEKYQQKLDEKKIEAAGIKAKLDELTSQLDKSQEDMKGIAEKKNAKQQEIESKFGKRDVDEEEKKLQDDIDNAETLSKQSITAYNDANKTLINLETSIEERQKNIQTHESALQKVRSEFEEGLRNQHFNDEDDFIRARIETEELNELARQAKQLDQRQIELQTSARDASTAYDEIKNKNITNRVRDEIKAERDQNSERNQSLRELYGVNRQKLEKQIENNAKSRDLQKKVDLVAVEYQRWSMLSDLLNQKKRNFRKFAQGITFNILLNKANEYLQNRKLMNRYELVRRNDEDQSLDFLVQDYYTGKMRPASNLSGGEKFCLSLALALGLSEMASKNVSIDSLFIDEGLGTLDDKTLDSALTVLKNLSSSNQSQLVGLITHVTRARELVTTQIVAEKLGGGHSKLTGPGCTNH